MIKNELIQALLNTRDMIKNEKLEKMKSTKSEHQNLFTQEFLKQSLEQKRSLGPQHTLSQTELNQAIQKYQALLCRSKMNNFVQDNQTEQNKAQILLNKTENYSQKSQTIHSHKFSLSDEKKETTISHTRQFTSKTGQEELIHNVSKISGTSLLLESRLSTPTKNGIFFSLHTVSPQQRQYEFSNKFNQYYLDSVKKAFAKNAESNQFTQIFRNHFQQTIQQLNIGSKLKPLQDRSQAIQSINLTKNPKYNGIYARQIDCITLVFDLDETLIHCNLIEDYPFDKNYKKDKLQALKANIVIRPYALTILEKLSKEFEIIIFTASNRNYGNLVIDHLDPYRKLISHRLFRDSCIATNGGMRTKDISLINRDLSRMVLIDNCACNFAWQPDNGIPIIPFYDNKTDSELLSLYDYIEQMKLCPDVRQFNRQHLQLYRFIHKIDFNSIQKMLLAGSD